MENKNFDHLTDYSNRLDNLCMMMNQQYCRYLRDTDNNMCSQDNCYYNQVGMRYRMIHS